MPARWGGLACGSSQQHVHCQQALVHAVTAGPTCWKSMESLTGHIQLACDIFLPRLMPLAGVESLKNVWWQVKWMLIPP